MTTITTYKNFNIPIEDVSLSSIISNIKSGTYHDSINAIRMAKGMGKPERADQLKKELLAFTPSATFKDGRKKELLTAYSGCVHLDFDKLTPEELQQAFDLAVKIPFTYACFTSPSGDGLKVFIKVNTDHHIHEQAYKQVQAYYEKEIGIEADPKCKDITRLCFVSDDTNAFLNESASTFEIALQEQAPLSEPLFEQAQKSNNTIFDECVSFTNNILTYNNGNRNNYLYQLACNCNRRGIPHPEAENLITSNFYHENQTEIRKSIESAYQNNSAEFGKFANLAGSQKKEIINDTTQDYLKSTPTIPIEAINLMPDLFREGARAFESDPRKRDVFLTSALCIISGCLPDVQGVYHQERVYPHLFSFIIAPAASGKGSLTFAKALGDKFHDKLVAESTEKLKIYKIELQEYKRKLSDKKQDISELEPPEEPPFKVLYIPANNSSARVIQHLKEGDEQGIFCETEADTMGAVLKQDWGSYSDLLRKAYHHEPISYSRKTNKEWVELKKPRLSVALAGTPGQVENLIKSAEDGLFSRFIFYTFKSEIVWIPASDTLNGINLTAHFEALSDRVLNFVEFLQNYETVRFKLTPEQWVKLNAYGEDCLTTLATFVSEDLSSTSKRLGLILYRVAMIITALRYFDNAELSPEYICSDEDFEMAFKLVKVYQEHSVFMFKELPKQATVTDKLLKQFFDKLPTSFRRKEAVTLAEAQFGIKERTADLYLSKLVAFKWIDKTRNSIYQKIKQ